VANPLDLLHRLLERVPSPRVHLLRARHYRNTFEGESAEYVLGDLARFCHAYSTIHVNGDSLGSAQLEGRRQVFLRIMEYSKLEPGRLLAFAADAQGFERQELEEETR
jgi:hypothetical protein